MITWFWDRSRISICGFKRFSSFDPSLGKHVSPLYSHDFRPWPDPHLRETILGDTLGKLEQCQRYFYAFTIFGTFPKDVLTVLPRPNSCDGLGSRNIDTPWVQPTPPGLEFWINACLVWRQITNFSILVWVLTFFLV